MYKQQIFYTSTLETVLRPLLCRYDKVYLLTDTTTTKVCKPLLGNIVENLIEIIIPAGDEEKDLRSVMHIWDFMQNDMATRSSALINLGGGMVTDLGGFAASCFKRGIDFYNVPTTLLAMVDAAVGGKTGINYHAYKNEIGVFSEAESVFINTDFLRTLSLSDLASGYAEMLKHALLTGGEMWRRHIAFDISLPDYDAFPLLVSESIQTKQHIVMEDPHEKGLRKALNAGHTVGHALETWGMKHNSPHLHGYYVAWGLLAELFMSVEYGFPVEELRGVQHFVAANYERLTIECKDYEVLYDLMRHDKKNKGGRINFTLFEDIGCPILDSHVDKTLLFDAFDFIREV